MSFNVEVLGRAEYSETVESMLRFTTERTAETADALWLCEHPPVFTQGVAGKSAHLLNTGTIPVMTSNRGGQVTFHGPGQVVAYPLVDLRRAGYFVKEYVYRLEEAVIRTLAHFAVTGHRVAHAPGIYVRLSDPHGHSVLDQWPRSVNPAQAGVDAASAAPDFSGLGKIAALGIKVSRHCTLHGVALNVSMDLSPYERINPCGYSGLQTVDLSTIGVQTTWNEVAQVLRRQLVSRLAP